MERKAVSETLAAVYIESCNRLDLDPTRLSDEIVVCCLKDSRASRFFVELQVVDEADADLVFVGVRFSDSNGD